MQVFILRKIADNGSVRHGYETIKLEDSAGKKLQIKFFE